MAKTRPVVGFNFGKPRSYVRGVAGKAGLKDVVTLCEYKRQEIEGSDKDEDIETLDESV